MVDSNAASYCGAVNQGRVGIDLGPNATVDSCLAVDRHPPRRVVLAKRGTYPQGEALVNLNPIVISVAALAVSTLSLAMTLLTAAVNRRLQWEQMRGEIVNRLTARGIEISMAVHTLRARNDPLTKPLTHQLIQVLEGLVGIRTRFRNMKLPAIFPYSMILTRMTPIKYEIDDVDPVFESMRSSIDDGNLEEAKKNADGLLRRFYGSSMEPGRRESGVK